jgi:Ca2+-binding EF-hand superfamily protein
MKTLTKTLLGAGALALVAGGYAFAEGPMRGNCGPMMGQDGAMMGPMGGPMMGRHGDRGAMLEKMFERFDTNKDGVVTLDEVVAFADAQFDKIDTNHDGVLDKTEIESWIGRRAPAEAVAHFIAVHDLDGDGKITKAEWEKPMKKRFALYDRNDDGKITKEEAALAMPMGPRKGGHHWGMNGPGMGWQQGNQPGAAPDAPKPAK